MESLAAKFVASLARGEPDRGILATAGEPEPAAAAAAFLRAAQDPDLVASNEVWVPALLRSARPGFGAQCLAELAQRRRENGHPTLDVVAMPALPRLLGSSNFLARLLLKDTTWLDELKGAMPSVDSAPVAPEWAAIRHAKYRGLLQIAARDGLGRPFAESLSELSVLAERCLTAALVCTAGETGVAPPSLLALGKLGGSELNFSSDVDLLFLYEEPPGQDNLEYHAEVSRLVRHCRHGLEVPTPDGFIYRVDLDLRPEGKAGVLANSVDAALTYYESFGAEWERQMLIRLRYVAGPRDAAVRFAQAITPFVYQRSIDPETIRSVRDMKLRIENERRHQHRDADANLKEGPGGIRDVEFLVQALQLFFGGRHVELRTGNVLDALDVLARLGILPEATSVALRDAYIWLRSAEHALQLVEEQQTSQVPSDARARLALARRLGYDDPEGENARNRFLDDWTTVRNEVRAHFEALTLGDPT